VAGFAAAEKAFVGIPAIVIATICNAVMRRIVRTANRVLLL